MERALRRQSIELRKSAKLIFVPLYVITSEYESSFLSLILESNLCMAFGALYIKRLMDSKLEYKEHARSVITKATGTWNHFRCKCSWRWGLPLQTQVLFYRTVIQPPAFYAFEVCGEHKRFPNFSKQDYSIHTTELSLTVNYSSRVSPR